MFAKKNKVNKKAKIVPKKMQLNPEISSVALQIFLAFAILKFF